MKRFVAVFCLLGLAGCAGGGLVAVDGVSTMATKKTLVDHAVSYASGKNCFSTRKDRGLTYCEEDEITPHMNVYCYRTLGEVTCYDRPMFDGKQQRVRQGGEIPR